ncbi:hypothetical protein V1511DRAFT_463368 [Dipodascopsis uninucleata]
MLFVAVFLLLSALAVGLFLSNSTKNIAIFAWNCFLKPFTNVTNADQQAQLESFYQGQASVYDLTRSKLLQGREEMLQLVAAHTANKKNIMWIDIGGGTGWNIERMNEYRKIEEFSAVYLVDLSPSLCKVARTRFEARGWKNVHVICADAAAFQLAEGITDSRNADIITLSYSLSMIPTFYAAIDRLERQMDDDGIIGVVDFYAQSTASLCGRTNLGGELFRHVNWFSRTFWRLWFEFDRVYLDPSRRDYLEYCFGTIKTVNSRNKYLGRIPFYIWVGCKKDRDSELTKKIDAMATESPYLLPALNGDETPELTKSASIVAAKMMGSDEFVEVRSKGYEVAALNLQKNFPLPSFFYQNEMWRMFYDERLPKYNQFSQQYIYAFTWEDSQEDELILKFNSDDTVLAITSAGDNALAYAALPSPPRRIHCVDLNPQQNHLLELKLAAFSTLSYEDIWKMFGIGKHADFANILISKLSPKLSSHAFQYWMHNLNTFTSGRGLYDTGSTRWAIRIARWAFKLAGVSEEVKKLCSAKTMSEQRSIWANKIRPAIVNPWFARVILNNPLFLWKALGVPKHQAEMVTESASANNVNGFLDYIMDTLDPLIDRSLISDDNYFYLLCLQGFYSPKNCPPYLRKDAYQRLAAPRALDGFRIHTDEIVDVVNRFHKHTLTKAIVMDHMDWFSEDGKDAEREIRALNRVLKKGGQVLFRTASKHPWYTKVYEASGFKCKVIRTRAKHRYIDRTNMYASTWVATKISDLDGDIESLKL